MKIGLCTYGDPGKELPEGLKFIELGLQQFLVPKEGEEVFAAKMAEVKKWSRPVRVGISLFPGDMKTSGPTVDEGALDKYVGTTFARGKRMGMKMIVFGSGASRTAPEGFDHEKAVEQVEGHLRRWGPMAKEQGLILALEPLCKREGNMINRLSEGTELVRRVNHPNVQLVADTFHMGVEGEGAEAIVEAGELIADVHVAEVEGRRPPGTKGEDLRGYFRALKEIGYKGGVSMEAAWQDMGKEVPRAVEYIREQWERA